MSKFRLAIFTGNYNHIRDGVSLTLNRLVEFLMKREVEILVFGPTVENPEVNHKGEFVAVPSKPAPGRPEYRLSTGFSSEAKEKLMRFDPDIVHLATPDVLGYQALRWGVKNNKYIVSSYHTHFPGYLKYYKLQWLESLGWKYLRWFYRHCSQIFVPTPSMADELIQQGIDKGLIIWARGVETERFNPGKRSADWRKKHGIQEDDVVVLFVSRLVWEKNLKMFADVCKSLSEKHSNLKAVVVGDGPAAGGLKKILPEAIMTGFLNGENLATAYACGDLFLFPSDTETFGSVTLEAMASGLPCVVADAAGSKSLVKNGINGYKAEVTDFGNFRDKVDILVSNRQKREEMGKNSLEIARQYSWESINSKLLNCYLELLDKEGACEYYT